jgi:hypothetical protein
MRTDQGRFVIIGVNGLDDNAGHARHGMDSASLDAVIAIRIRMTGP